MSTLKIEEREGVATVSLNRPQVRNAFNPEMIAELTAAFSSLGTRTDLVAIVLRGEGKSFCAGGDLEWMKSMAAFTLDENLADARQLFDMFAVIQECGLPVIARLHGHVMGGATGLAAVCDFAAAESGTRFGFSEVRLGLAPAVISSFVLAKMQRSTAARYMLTGESFSAEEAARTGLIHYHGTIAELDAFIAKTISDLKGCGRSAVRKTKALLRQLSDRQGDVRDLTTRLIAEVRVSAEGQEGLQAFLQKREPAWRKDQK